MLSLRDFLDQKGFCVPFENAEPEGISGINYKPLYKQTTDRSPLVVICSNARVENHIKSSTHVPPCSTHFDFLKGGSKYLMTDQGSPTFLRVETER